MLKTAERSAATPGLPNSANIEQNIRPGFLLEGFLFGQETTAAQVSHIDCIDTGTVTHLGQIWPLAVG
jgi:hypothetical protein